MRILVTGGAGFIGSAVVRRLAGGGGHQVVNLDKLTYAADLRSLREVENAPGYRFLRADICDREAVADIFQAFQPQAVIHLAAESHVDRSIDQPGQFIQTNIVGTHNLLEAALTLWRDLPGAERDAFRFLHVSTDEVYGSLGMDGAFHETTCYDPRSPYSASKAAADHLAMAWHHTYGLPVLVSNCSNNYGPYQFPEKLIPLLTIKAMAGQRLPVYGRGENVRDWLHVEDHVSALLTILEKGRPGQSYNVGGDSERSNIEVVRTLCGLLDEMLPGSAHRPHEELIEFVADRPGHDLRYAMDHGKLTAETGWRPTLDFAAGLRATVSWYLESRWWWEPILDGRDQGGRLGLDREKS